MLLSFVFAAFALTSSALAAPTIPFGFKPEHPKYYCPKNLPNIVPPLNGLPKPADKLSGAVAAIGYQLYNCTAATSKYTSAGAVAQLFGITCLTGSQFANIDEELYSIWKAAAADADISVIPGLVRSKGVKVPHVGQHYFTQTANGLLPKWDLRDLLGPDAFVIAKKNTSAVAITGAQDIDSVLLDRVEGGLANEVVRTDTHGGQPPASCTPGSPPIRVKYGSTYFGFGGTIFNAI
jgi:hypothetical protein